MPFALALALFVAIFDLIPLVGATIAAVVVSLVGFTESVTVGLAVHRLLRGLPAVRELRRLPPGDAQGSRRPGAADAWSPCCWAVRCSASSVPCWPSRSRPPCCSCSGRWPSRGWTAPSYPADRLSRAGRGTPAPRRRTPPAPRPRVRCPAPGSTTSRPCGNASTIASTSACDARASSSPRMTRAGTSAARSVSSESGRAAIARWAQAAAGGGAASTSPLTRPGDKRAVPDRGRSEQRRQQVLDEHIRAVVGHEPRRDALPVRRGLWWVGGRLGVGQHQRTDPAGVPAQERHRRVAAHRQAAEHNLVETAGVQQRRNVVGHLVQRGLVPAERRPAEAALIRGDDVVPLAERVALLQPHRRRQRERVQQDDGAAGAGLPDVQVDGHAQHATDRDGERPTTDRERRQLVHGLTPAWPAWSPRSSGLAADSDRPEPALPTGRERPLMPK